MRLSLLFFGWWICLNVSAQQVDPGSDAPFAPQGIDSLSSVSNSRNNDKRHVEPAVKSISNNPSNSPMGRPGNSSDFSGKTVIWEIVSIFDAVSGEISEESGMLVKNANGRIEWRKPDGQIVGRYVVEGVAGAWLNPKENGMISYLVRSENGSGTIRIIRTNRHGTRVIITQSTEDSSTLFELYTK